ncbi:MAG TPA: hypothetical protein VKB31_10280 [Trueperaceae bacterium]|nr:hypothetical protein [Trueperaceae bacterium]
MNKRILLSAGLVLLLLAGCAPAIVQPKALVSPLAYKDAYLAVVHAINVEPYPAGSGGWVITHASQSGGFISAQMGWRQCSIGVGPFERPHCRDYRSLVTVTLVGRPDGQTEVNLGTNDTTEADKLATAIKAALGLSGATS